MKLSKELEHFKKTLSKVSFLGKDNAIETLNIYIQEVKKDEKLALLAHDFLIHCASDPYSSIEKALISLDGIIKEDKEMKSIDKKKERTFHGPLDGQIEAEGRLISLLKNYTPPNQKLNLKTIKELVDKAIDALGNCNEDICPCVEDVLSYLEAIKENE